MPLGNDASRQIELLADAFARWGQIKTSVPDLARMAPDSAFAFIDARLLALEKALAEAGSHPQQHGELLAQLQGDAVGLAEVSMVGGEGLWQLKTILNACHRRWPQLNARATPADAAVADWCDWVAERL